MLNLDYHKGQLCLFQPILCQEGFCSECIIALEQSAQTTPSIAEESQQCASQGKVNNGNPQKPNGVKSCVQI